MASSGDAAVPKPPTRWGTRIFLVLFAALIFPIGASIVYIFPPSEYPFYPRCMFHWATGLHCPGCGATRCVHALLRLDFPQAFAYNPLFVLVLPLLIYSGATTAYSMWTGKRVGGIRLPAWGVALLIAALLAYWILRNIDAYPFSLLAPHEL